MKYRKCPAKKFCFDYKCANCDGCEFAVVFKKLYRKIERLTAENERLKSRQKERDENDR